MEVLRGLLATLVACAVLCSQNFARAEVDQIEQVVETWFEVEPLKHGGYNVTWVWEYNTDITGFTVRFAQDPTLELPAQVLDVQYGSPEAEAKLNPDGMTPASAYVSFEDNDATLTEYHGSVVSNEDENETNLQLVKSPFFLLIDWYGFMARNAVDPVYT